MKVLIVCLLALLGSALAYKSYSGYQVLETDVLPDEQTVLKFAPLMGRPELDFWQTPRVGGRATIMVAPHYVAPLKLTLAAMGFKVSVLIPDVQVTVDNERAENDALRARDLREGRAPDFDRFYTFEEIQAWMDEVVAAYPSIASIINIGNSYEGRPLRLLKLSNGPGKSGIIFDSAIHAREWLGPPTLMYAINELTENLAANQAMLDANDFYFSLIANPDGYAYTWSDERLWRKTRSDNAGSNCVGTDPNRNWDESWAGGGQGSPCSDTYAGSAPFSEPETKALSDFVIATPSITFGFSVHSYGKYLLHPYGSTTNQPPNAAELTSIGREALDALEAVHGTRGYQLGSVANVLYLAYGSTTDWYYVKEGNPLSYTIELPGGGTAGFNPPPSLILPTVEETWAAYKVFAANIPASRK